MAGTGIAGRSAVRGKHLHPLGMKEPCWCEMGTKAPILEEGGRAEGEDGLIVQIP